jgi:hypothetical protein
LLWLTSMVPVLPPPPPPTPVIPISGRGLEAPICGYHSWATDNEEVIIDVEYRINENKPEVLLNVSKKKPDYAAKKPVFVSLLTKMLNFLAAEYIISSQLARRELVKECSSSFRVTEESDSLLDNQNKTLIEDCESIW